MSRRLKRVLPLMAVTAVVGAPLSFALAETAVSPTSQDLSSAPAANATAAPATDAKASDNPYDKPLMDSTGTVRHAVMAEAEAAPEPLKIHGLLDFTFKTHYVTPRGLVVENQGVTFQQLGILFFDVYDGQEGDLINNITLNIGIWNDLGSHHPGAGSTVDVWNEFDYFGGVDIKICKYFTVGVEYISFISPNDVFHEERNIEFKLAFDDTEWLGDWALHPYIKPFLQTAGSPVVVFGENNSFDVEIGIAPGYTFKGIPNLPVSFTFPVFFTMGPEDFYFSNGNAFAVANGGHKDGVIGCFSAGVNASIPLTFIPKAYGNWNLHAGFTYYNLINDNLQLASSAIGTGGHENIFIGSIGFGLNF